MTDRSWILVDDALPNVGQDVWYFFEVTGVSAGQYWGSEDGLATFGGARGFLGGDVTHWMPRTDGSPRPEIPAGYTYPERCLVHGNEMPFDCPATWSQGTREAPASPAVDWAHAAARGAFQSLYDDHDFRQTMRATPEDQRARLVEAVADIIRQAQRDAPLGVSAVDPHFQ